MKKNILLFLVAAACCLSSCSKDEDTKKITYTNLIFMDTYNEDIESMPIDGGTTSELMSNVKGVGIAYDKANEKIYYSDFADDTTPNGKIWQADVNGKNATTIVTGLNNPFGIALDSKNKKLYWGDEDGKVSRSNLDGSNIQTLVTIAGGAIRALAVDMTHSKLYFYDVNNNSLYQSNLDGSGKAVIVSGFYGYAIAVDEINNKIYFDAQTDDNSISALYRANLDGSSQTLIDDTQSRIYGIAIDNVNSKVYWSARDSFSIYQANLNGTLRKTLNSAELGSPRGIFLKY